MTKTRKTNAGPWAPRVQLATYPQSPLSGPVRCCDVMDLYQAFSQPPGPGRLWISLGAGLLDGPRKSTHTQKTDTNPFQDPQTLLQNLTHTTPTGRGPEG